MGEKEKGVRELGRERRGRGRKREIVREDGKEVTIRREREGDREE